MADHFHDIGDLICGDDASPFALGTNPSRHAILVGLEDCCLMETDRGGMNIHVQKHNIRICYASG